MKRSMANGGKTMRIWAWLPLGALFAALCVPAPGRADTAGDGAAGTGRGDGETAAEPASLPLPE